MNTSPAPSPVARCAIPLAGRVVAGVLLPLALAACNGESPQPGRAPATPPDASLPAPAPVTAAAPAAAPPSADAHAAARAAMVRDQIEARGVADARVLAALRKVPRHEFVPARVRAAAYDDRPLPIGEDQTISQPYIVAAMTAAVAPAPGEKVLEIGTGSGYQAAVLAELGAAVYTIEIVPALADTAAATLRRLGYTGINTRCGDGFAGWPEAAPFDAILVTCAPEETPPALLAQLKTGGRLVLPRGPEGRTQDLILIRKTADGLAETNLGAVLFVPMTGAAQRRE